MKLKNLKAKPKSKISKKDWQTCVEICKNLKIEPTDDNVRAAYMNYFY